ncbi:hypothetical protein D0809_05745 [Flavobacterium circumlabens]|uniref:DUF4595 domain-containing protein n=1 Tax=Flavobacterium circumlabens TaxID=2133765 RepID=A0A4Y7UE42_9FLAO|nr:hypothetical protein [Flavobacterium circumlabens]TCN59395.1 hypothetical protein EV142_10210 [Flavobacterium circumlabens]TEB44705.1 hypothetical protein D0809_05745 [Flavobacterium circumlabens]
MKFQKLSLLPLDLMVFSLYSCSSDDSSESDQEVVIVTPAEEKLVSVSNPSGSNMAYMQDKQEFKYDDQKRVNLVGYYFSISYVNDELIETKTLGDDVSNADIETKSSITLKNKNITSIISNTVYKRTTGETYSIERDSTVYSYENEYISKIVHYQKRSITGDGKYRLERKMDFQVTNGNITQVKTNDPYNGIVVTNYTYDNTPNILMGDFAYETPLSLVRGYNILMHDKLGKRSANNIVTMENVFTETPFQICYEKISYKRVLDKSGRIKEILLSGNSITSNAAYYPLGNFKDEKVIFEYK